MVLFINYHVMCYTFAYLLQSLQKGLSSSMEFSLYFLRYQIKYTWRVGNGQIGALSENYNAFFWWDNQKFPTFRGNIAPN